MRRPPFAAGRGPVIVFAAAVAASSWIFSNQFVHGVQSTNVERFTEVFIPLLTVAIHLTLARLLPRALFAAVLVADGVATLVLATHASYFGDNFHIHAAIANATEAHAVVGYALKLVPTPMLLLVVGVIAVEVLLQPAVQRTTRPRHLVALWVPTALLACLGLWKVPPKRAALITDYTLSIKLHGYYSALLFDLWFSGGVPSGEELRADLVRLQDERPVPIPGWRLDPPPSVRRIVVVQVESLDWNVLGHVEAGREVTPFLNGLRASALTVPLEPIHYSGSGTAGADFQFLTGRHPLPNYPTFRVPGVDYSDALPHVVASLGGEARAYHGNDGSMWGRRAAFAEMGFREMTFARDFSRLDSRWGVSDSLFLAEALDAIRASGPARSFHFLVTLSSHGPFDYVDNPVWPARDLVAKYFNSINYTDRHLQRFVTALPDTTLLVIFGDHAAGVRNATYTSLVGRAERVPGMIALLVDGVPGVPPILGEPSPREGEVLDIRSLGILTRDAALRVWGSRTDSSGGG